MKNYSYDATLIINLGSPDKPDIPSIRKYLSEFLMDPLVLNIPKPLRAALVYGIILPFRPKKTLHAYESIWTKEGSPLILNTKLFANKLHNFYEKPVEIAMRYGNPNFETALEKLKESSCKKINIVMMYPQYALSTTETARIKLEELNQNVFQNYFEFHYIQDFYNDEGFIQSVTSKIKEAKVFDHILFSYHGLPWSHLGKAVNAQKCKTQNCCDQITEINKNCYRAQSFATTRRIVDKLNLPKEKWSIGFQSRLTRGWIEPFTDIVTQELVKKGVKKLAIVCPSFTADCLETLEEIQIREKEAFLEAGGESFEYIPCVNDDETFVKSILHKLK